MKKNILSSMLLLAGLSFFTACDDDRDSNPIIQQPTEFVLNTPAYASTTIDLASSTETINMSWSQPDYGFPVVATYYVQVSTSGEFTHSVDEADADKTGTIVADYVQLDGVTTCTTEITPVIFDKALNQLCKWAEDAVPATLDLYVRVKSCINTASENGLYEIISNVVNMSVSPYYMVLKDADPAFWYILGSGASGAWENGPDKIGKSMIPMAVIKDEEYDKKTGDGKFEFIGYFGDSGFKIIKNIGLWDEQWGQNDAGTLIMKDGNDIKPKPGYYKLELNPIEKTLKMTPEDIEPKTYETIGLIGVDGDWNKDIPLTQFAATVNPHLWTATVEIKNDTEAKFRADGAWDMDWGNSGFPFGYGVEKGQNFVITAGKYLIIFNDINGSYHFFAQD